jgi:hypothetical protein
MISWQVSNHVKADFALFHTWHATSTTNTFICRWDKKQQKSIKYIGATSLENQNTFWSLEAMNYY